MKSPIKTFALKERRLFAFWYLLKEIWMMLFCLFWNKPKKRCKTTSQDSAISLLGSTLINIKTGKKSLRLKEGIFPNWESWEQGLDWDLLKMIASLYKPKTSFPSWRKLQGAMQGQICSDKEFLNSAQNCKNFTHIFTFYFVCIFALNLFSAFSLF